MPSFRSIEKELRSRLEGEVFLDDKTRREYSTAACWYRIAPIAVVFPKHAQDVAHVVRLCHDNDIAVIPRGAATGLAGQALGFGVVLDFTKHMNRMIAATPDTARVEPGIVYADLINQLKPFNRFFPIDPASGSLCTLGGMIGTNAAGYHGLKYGATKDFVSELELVLSNGEIVSIGTRETDQSGGGLLWEEIRSRIPPLIVQNRDLIRSGFPAVPKNSSGYNLIDAAATDPPDLTKLVIGSEGTLAMVTGATLKLLTPPPVRVGAIVYFSSYESAVEGIVAGKNLSPTAIEILDQTYVRLAAGFSKETDALIRSDSPVMLYFEFEGEDRAAQEKLLGDLNRILRSSSLLSFLPLPLEDQQQALWRLRERASQAINLEKSTGKTSFIEDVTVPLAHLSAYLHSLRSLLTRHHIEYSIYGHGGVGNIHCAAFVDLKKIEHYRVIDSIASEVADLALSFGGTLSGEHGDGFVRTPFLERMYGKEIYALFASIKEIFDPKNIFNPGKIIGTQNASILHDLHIS